MVLSQNCQGKLQFIHFVIFPDKFSNSDNTARGKFVYTKNAIDLNISRMTEKGRVYNSDISASESRIVEKAIGVLYGKCTYLLNDNILYFHIENDIYKFRRDERSD